MNRFNTKQRIIGRLIIINLILLLGALYWFGQSQQGVQVAVAKGSAAFYAYSLPGVALDAAWVQEAALADPVLAEWTAVRKVDFVNAVRLSEGEARPWQADGCAQGNCAHVTFYNHTDGGAIEAVVNLDTAQVIDRRRNANARPGGSPFIAPKALAIAAADAEVTAVLGDVTQAEQAMVPMSGWLTDSACADAWCVDLTFHDPAGSGRIFHVFVNMEEEAVARTFYTRGRADLAVSAPPPQRYAFSDGCHEQYGWEVCWEMTAHDGINFRDATYRGDLIFSTAKISQIEAWYPSWPGGYRDEIGFSASVPPYGDTEINDFGDSFEVRQLFTEFTRWPNCICCYRYEEIVRFFEDGTVEFRFISHGPGCDDLSEYRPFWRIDVDLDGPEGDTVWLWNTDHWLDTEETEFETFPVVDDVSPEGDKLATFDDDMIYLWQMDRTDPLGLDEAYLFALQMNEGEGDGPVLTGPGNTYEPPRQWVNGERIVDENIVLWYVPLLKTKKSNPYWCMPDPEPGINQCEAVLRARPSAEIHQPTAEEIAEAAAQATPTVEPTPLPTPEPTPTPRPVEGETAEDIILNSGCGACHIIGSLGEAGKVGPDLSTIGLVAGERVPGLSAEEYLRQSILEPNAYLTPDCPNGPCLANIMPQDYNTRLTPAQVEIMVQFLLTQTEETRPTPSPIGADAPTPAPKPFPAPKTAGSSSPAQEPALIAVQVLLVTLVFLLSLFRLLKS